VTPQFQPLNELSRVSRVIPKWFLRMVASLSWSCYLLLFPSIHTSRKLQASTHLPREPLKFVFIVVLHTDTELKLTRHAHPLGPFDICVGYGGDTLRVDAFPCHTAGRDPELWNFIRKDCVYLFFRKVENAFVLPSSGDIPWYIRSNWVVMVVVKRKRVAESENPTTRFRLGFLCPNSLPSKSLIV